MDRKLSAILAADVVGYSKHMERDEQGTYERLVAGRKELFEPEIARHHGRVFKLMGAFWPSSRVWLMPWNALLPCNGDWRSAMPPCQLRIG